MKCKVKTKTLGGSSALNHWVMTVGQLEGTGCQCPLWRQPITAIRVAGWSTGGTLPPAGFLVKTLDASP